MARVRALGAFASSVRSFTFALVAMLLSLFAIQANAQVRYYYDEIGRLVQVVAPDGTSGQYSYDAVGNILSIKQLASTAVSISEFTSNAGPVGTTVTIYGSGYSSSPADNTVQRHNCSCRHCNGHLTHRHCAGRSDIGRDFRQQHQRVGDQ